MTGRDFSFCGGEANHGCALVPDLSRHVDFASQEPSSGHCQFKLAHHPEAPEEWVCGLRWDLWWWTTWDAQASEWIVGRNKVQETATADKGGVGRRRAVAQLRETALTPKHGGRLLSSRNKDPRLTQRLLPLMLPLPLVFLEMFWMLMLWTRRSILIQIRILLILVLKMCSNRTRGQELGGGERFVIEQMQRRH